MGIRPARADEVNYILSVSLRNTWASTRFEHDLHYKKHRSYLVGILSHNPCEVFEDEGRVQGFLCHKPGTPHRVHVLYVRRSLNRQGIGRALVESVGIKEGDAVLTTYRPPSWAFDRENSPWTVYWDPWGSL